MKTTDKHNKSILAKTILKTDMYYTLIDNGHGKDTKGKRSPDGLILEYAYTRELAADIYERLLITNYIKPILITPERKDIPLATRVQRINNYCNKYGAKNCIMISLHLNAAGNGQWMNGSGWECYTTPGQNNSDKLADLLYKHANNVFYPNVKIRTDYTDGDIDKESNFYIIRTSNCPAVLTENLFMDSHKDADYLLSATGFNNIVDLHVNAIKEWFDNLEKI